MKNSAQDYDTYLRGNSSRDGLPDCRFDFNTKLRSGTAKIQGSIDNAIVSFESVVWSFNHDAEIELTIEEKERLTDVVLDWWKN